MIQSNSPIPQRESERNFKDVNNVKSKLKSGEITRDEQIRKKNWGPNRETSFGAAMCC